MTRINFLGSNIADNLPRSRVCIGPEMAIPCHDIGVQSQKIGLEVHATERSDKNNHSHRLKMAEMAGDALQSHSLF